MSRIVLILSIAMSGKRSSREWPLLVLREAERCLIFFLLITRYHQFQLIALVISNVSAWPETRRKKCHLLAFSGHYPCPGGREKPCTHYLDEDRRSRYDLRLICKLLWCLQQQWLASPVASALGGQDAGSECGRNFPQKSRRFNLNPRTTIEAGCSNGIHCVATGRWRRSGWRLGNEHQDGIRTSRQLRDATPPTRRLAR